MKEKRHTNMRDFVCVRACLVLPEIGTQANLVSLLTYRNTNFDRMTFSVSERLRGREGQLVCAEHAEYTDLEKIYLCLSRRNGASHSRFDLVPQGGSVKLKVKAMRPVWEVTKANASTLTHQNVTVQIGKEAREFVSLGTLAPSGTWRRRYRCKPYRGRASITVPIAHNSTQEKEMQAEERKILSVTSLQAQLQCIRQCFAKAWSGVPASSKRVNLVRIAGEIKKNINSDRFKLNK